MKRLSTFEPGQRRIILRAATAALTLGVLVALIGASVASASGVAFKSGDVLAGVGVGEIKHFDPSGNLLDTLNTTVGREDTGMCFDPAWSLYSTNFLGDMSKFDNHGNLLEAAFGSGFSTDPESCVFDAANNMYVGQADGSKRVLKFNTSGTLLSSFSPTTGPRGSDWVDLAGDQCTLHYTSEGTEIKAFNVCANTQLPAFAVGLPEPCYAHRILADGGELVACGEGAGVTEVVRTNSHGAVIQTYKPGGTDLFALALDPDGTSFWTEDGGSGQIWRVDIASGTVLTTFNAGITIPFSGLAVVGELTAGRTTVFVTKAAVNEVSRAVPVTGVVKEGAYIQGKTSLAKIICKAAGTITGAVTTAKTSTKNVIRFKECETSPSLKCQSISPAGSSGEIITKNLEGELGEVGAGKPGIAFSPESGPLLAEFECGGGADLINLEGKVIGSLSGANGLTPAQNVIGASLSLTFAQTNGRQHYTHFEGGPTDVLTSVIRKFPTYETETEQSGEATAITLVSVPAKDIGVTK